MAITGKGVFLDFADEIKRMGREWIDGQYGNLFDMYEEITDDDPHETPMMIYPASHYTMGGLWVDYNLMSNVKGLHVLGEANFLRPRRQPPGRFRPDAGPVRRATSSSPPRCQPT